ncbi:hypothetical protein OG889_32425 [Streptomyces sp. NBC_00481]|nr:hypothetical protein [Streptomyces sp. NBC_00481]WRZ01812.1 hypothetical protein OG889_32425 [Streptomyces sp. NBC_00481]
MSYGGGLLLVGTERAAGTEGRRRFRDRLSRLSAQLASPPPIHW